MNPFNNNKNNANASDRISRLKAATIIKNTPLSKKYNSYNQKINYTNNALNQTCDKTCTKDIHNNIFNGRDNIYNQKLNLNNISDYSIAMPITYFGSTSSASTSSGDFVKRIGDTMSGNLDMTNNKVLQIGNGTDAGDAVNKGQLDGVETTATQASSLATTANTVATQAQTLANNALPKSGGTMSGNLDMTNNKVVQIGNGTDAGDAVNKGQLDGVETTATQASSLATTANTVATQAQTLANNALPKSGGTMSGDIAMNSNGINTVGTISGSVAAFGSLRGSGVGTGNILGGMTFLNGTTVLNGEIVLRDISSSSPNNFITQGINGTNSGVINNLYSGEVIVVKSGETMPSGTVVSFAHDGNDTDVFKLTTCKPGNGENGASSQPLGVLLQDATLNSAARVAVSGITTCISDGTIDYKRGGMLQVAGTKGRVTQGTASTNTASVGICLSGGQKSVNDPVLVMLHSNYESY
jgi:hypothetical protein